MDDEKLGVIWAIFFTIALVVAFLFTTIALMIPIANVFIASALFGEGKNNDKQK